MLRSMYTAISGLRNHQTMLDVTANNIANVNTYGFKASSTSFADILGQTVQGASAPSATLGGTNAKTVGIGMAVEAITQRHIQGGIINTGVNTDFALNGEGFFEVTDNPASLATPTGDVAYARAGNFGFDAEGHLVTQDGSFVIGNAVAAGPPPTADPDPALRAPIQVDPALYSTWRISTGTGLVEGQDATGAWTPLSFIALARFANNSGLQQAGNNKWVESPNSGTPLAGNPGMPGFGKVMTGVLEMSNVDLSSEFTEMIKAQRGFQANARVITTSDEILQELVNLKR